MLHKISVDQIRPGDVIVGLDGIRRPVHATYRPDWRAGTRCIELAASEDPLAPIEASYFNLSTVVTIDH